MARKSRTSSAWTFRSTTNGFQTVAIVDAWIDGTQAKARITTTTDARPGMSFSGDIRTYRNTITGRITEAVVIGQDPSFNGHGKSIIEAVEDWASRQIKVALAQPFNQ